MGEQRQKRRQLRERRRVREAMLLDLGALVYELHRQGRRAPELLQRKAAELTVVDDEVRELEDALAGAAGQAPEPPEETAEVDAVWDEGPLPGEAGDELAGDELEAEDLDRDDLDDGYLGHGEHGHEAQGHEDPDQEPAFAEHEDPRA